MCGTSAINSLVLPKEKMKDMDKIRTGLAAFGMSGQVFHAPFISTNPHFELTAVTERSKELSRAKYPQSRIVRSFDELIGMEELELVVVNTPDSSHYEYARATGTVGTGNGKDDCFLIHKPNYNFITFPVRLLSHAASIRRITPSTPHASLCNTSPFRIC